MPKKAHKLQRLVTYISTETMLRCKADAGGMSMTPSEYVAAVLAARFGHLTLKPPVMPTQLAKPSRGTEAWLPGTGGTLRAVPPVAQRQNKETIWLNDDGNEVDEHGRIIKG